MGLVRGRLCYFNSRKIHIQLIGSTQPLSTILGRRSIPRRSWKTLANTTHHVQAGTSRKHARGLFPFSGDPPQLISISICNVAEVMLRSLPNGQLVLQEYREVGVLVEELLTIRRTSLIVLGQECWFVSVIILVESMRSQKCAAHSQHYDSRNCSCPVLSSKRGACNSVELCKLYLRLTPTSPIRLRSNSMLRSAASFNLSATVQLHHEYSNLAGPEPFSDTHIYTAVPEHGHSDPTCPCYLC